MLVCKIWLSCLIYIYNQFTKFVNLLRDFRCKLAFLL